MTIAADVIGRTLRGAGRLQVSRKSFEYQGPTAVETAFFDELTPGTGRLNLVLGTVGVKFNPVGGVRLQVSNLQRSVEYYENVLGICVHHATGDTAALGPHGEKRPWSGPAPAADEARLLGWTLLVSSAGDVAAAGRSLRAAGYVIEDTAGEVIATDPWGTRMRLLLSPSPARQGSTQSPTSGHPDPGSTLGVESWCISPVVGSRRDHFSCPRSGPSTSPLWTAV